MHIATTLIARILLPQMTDGCLYLVPTDNNVTINTHNATTTTTTSNNNNINNNNNNLNITSYAHNSHDVFTA